jgi:hypothetical protein
MLGFKHRHLDAGQKTRETDLKTLPEPAATTAVAQLALSCGKQASSSQHPPEKHENVVI